MPLKTDSASGQRTSQGSVAECKPLLEIATRDIFRQNVFRVTGLSVDATAKEIAKHAGNLKVMEELGQGMNHHKHVFSRPRPTMDQIREAIQTLKDPERRLVDEFFWFWPREFGKSSSDPALQALAKGELQGAYDIWSTYEADPKDGVVATHNKALTTQIIALDRERTRIERNPAEEGEKENAAFGCSDIESPGDGVDLEEEAKEIESYWQRSFKRWQCLVDDDRLWDRVTARVRQIDDPRLKTGFVRRMRASLPEALDKINAELALSYAQAGKLELAQLHIRFMRELNQGMETVEKIAELVLSPVKTHLREHIGRAEKQAKEAPSEGPKIAKQLLDEAQRCLPIFDLFFGNDHESRNDLFDEVATVCNQVVVAYHNQAKDDTTCQAILKTVLPLATSIDLRSRLEKNIAIFGGNLRLKEADGVYSLFKEIQESDGSAESKYARFNKEALPAIIKVAKITGVSASGGMLGGDSEEYAELFDSAAVVLRGISIDAWNEDDDAQTAFGAVELALTLVRDAKVKKRLQEDKQKLEELRASQVAQAKAAKLEAERQEKERKRKQKIGWLVAAGVVGLMIYGSMSSNNNPSGGSSTTSTPQSSSDTPPASGYGNTYRVPSYISSELAQDKRAIETQKAALESLGREIDSTRSLLDHTSEWSVQQFNGKVDRYNSMRGSYNQMVDSYNEKLRRNGR